MAFDVKRRGPLVALAAAAVATWAVACGGGEGSAGAGGGATSTASTAAATSKAASTGSPAASAPAAPAVSSAVAVELTEWDVKASGTARAGSIAFTTKNAGSTPHELVVLKADDPAALQKTASGVVDEAKHGAAGKTKQIPDGQSEKLEVSLSAGRYVLICNVAGHYDLGMRAAFTVQ